MTLYREENCSLTHAAADGLAGLLPPQDRAGPGRGIWVVRRSAHRFREEFLPAVDATFDAIERIPEMFRRVHGEVRRANVSRFPYAVYYRIDPKSVVVLTVLHTARDPKLWPQPKIRAR